MQYSCLPPPASLSNAQCRGSLKLNHQACIDGDGLCCVHSLPAAIAVNGSSLLNYLLTVKGQQGHLLAIVIPQKEGRAVLISQARLKRSKTPASPLVPPNVHGLLLYGIVSRWSNSHVCLRTSQTKPQS